MLGFLNDPNYEQRKLARNDYPWGFVSTIACTDGSKPFETAVSHDKYHVADNTIVVVEHYDTREEAQRGHDRWVRTMTAEILPAVLTDCNNAGLAQLLTALTATPLN